MIERVDEKFPGLSFMKPAQAAFIRDLVTQHSLDNLLELGTLHGKGTAYMAIIQEERGRGHVTTLDRARSADISPNAEEVISALGMEHRVTIRRAERSFTHTLMQMLEEKPRPKFDFAYIDGAHTWDGTGFSFYLVDLLLRPGGWVIFDDLDWTIEKADSQKKKRMRSYRDYSIEERKLPLVRKVWEILVPEAGYINRRERERWGIAQKPG
jgi:predicted O-methyltransferase YrrM